MASMTLSVLSSVYAGRDASKRMSRDAGVSYRTAEKWWAKLTTPRADVLLRMMRENEALRAEMLLALTGDAYAGLDTDVAGEAGAAKGRAVARRGGTVASPIAGPAEGVARRDGRGRVL